MRTEDIKDDDNPTDGVGQTAQTPARPEESAFDMAELRRELTTQVARDARQELEHLKKLLGAQDAAKLHAQTIAAQLQRQLKTLEADNGRLRAEIKRLQDQLAFAKNEGSLELRRALDREAALNQELIDARSQTSRAIDKATGYRRKWVVAGLAVLVPALVFATVSYVHARGPSTPASDDADNSVATVSQPDVKTPKSSSHDLDAGLGRLDHAIDAFKGEKPEDVLQRVHLQNAARGISVCSFEWNNGDVSLEFGSKEGTNLNAAMVSCADAVEKAAKDGK